MTSSMLVKAPLIVGPLLLGSLLLFNSISKGDIDKIDQEASKAVTTSFNSTPTYDIGVTTLPESPNLSDNSKMEIEVSSKEILEADKEGLIGSNNPFNPRFITEEDVEASVNSILKKGGYEENYFNEEYMEYVINLRHIEMTDFVTEDESMVLKVAEEYKDKQNNTAK